MKKRIMGMVLALTMLTIYVPCVYAAEIIHSGNCGYNGISLHGYGDNLTWTLDSEGTLTVSGEGEMYYAVSGDRQPWREYREQIMTVILEDGVEEIGHSAFYGFSNLKNVKIPDSITSIPLGTFGNCSSLEKIHFGKNITSIDTLTAFNGCSSLKEIIIDEENEKYCSIDGVVYSKDKETLYKYPPGKIGNSYNILNSVNIIDSGAFRESNLKEITIPNGITDVGGKWSTRVFHNCKLLETINIPESVIVMDRGNFDGCSSLQNINVDEQNQTFSSVDGVLFNKDKTILYVYPQSRKGSYSIPEGVERCYFTDCENLTNVIIPKSMTEINRNMFAGCSGLTSMIIPDNISNIGSWAFEKCSNLTNITISGNIKSISLNAFEGCSSLTDVYYSGTEADWEKIDIDESGNSALKNANIHYNHIVSQPIEPKHFIISETSVTNTSDTEQTAAIIIAEYDGGKLTNVTTEKITFAANETKAFTVPQGGKIFVWNSLSGMQPLVK